jgi:mRNA interferase MazF
MNEELYLPDVGHLIWTDFDPSLDPILGREQTGRRPALVLSPSAFALNTGFAIVCPITKKVRPFPTSVVLPDGLPIGGEILLSHVRSIDIRARPILYAGASVPAEIAQEVRAKLNVLIAI